jgi:hypothetical protein
MIGGMMGSSRREKTIKPGKKTKKELKEKRSKGKDGKSD